MAIWLIREEVFERLKPYFPKSRGKVRVDDRSMISEVYVLHNGLMAGCPEGIWALQDVVQPFYPVGQDGDIR
jgi:hypothetical protein